jgi:protein TonB
VGKAVSNPSLVSGGPSDADNRGGRYRGAVVVQFAVNSEGRVSSCSPVRSSGNRDLDALTCRLLVNRARFRPARDAQGRAVETDAHATYHWGRGRRGRS